MKRVAFIFHDLGVGGVQKKILDTIQELKSQEGKAYKDHFKIIILLEKEKAYDLQNDLFVDEAINLGCEIHYYRPRVGVNYQSLRIPFSFFVLTKLLWFKPDTVVAFMESYAISAIIAKFVCMVLKGIKIKVIIGFDNIPSLFFKLIYGHRIRYKYLHILINFFFRFADRIIVPSDISKADFINNFNISKENIIVNKNWVSIPKKHASVHKKYDIIYVGRVDKVKNLKKFIRVVYDIKKSIPNLKACIVGWGEDIEKILFEIKRLNLRDTIELTGSQKDVGYYYSHSKIFLLTSDFEGLPMVGLEAMSWQMPIVSSKYPGVHEMVLDGSTGYVCNSIADFKMKIIFLIKNNRARVKMGKTAKLYVKTNHSLANLKSFADLIVSV